VSVITVGGDEPCGLRERKKARTREALLEAGLRLFTEHGFTETTTQAIAAEADVSQRTLFRYFASKEDIVLAVVDDAEEAFRLQVAARPAAEHPFAALVHAADATWGDLDSRALETHVRLLRLCDGTPRLSAARLQRSATHLRLLAAVIARRTGADARDPRPELLAAAFGSAVHVAVTRCCRLGGTEVEDLLESVRTCLRHLAPALTEPWGGGPAPTGGA
jgi:AcrR family transcriptional regulator